MRTALVLLLALAAPSARADEPIALRWALKDGDTFYTTTHITQSHTLETGGKTVETALGFDLTLRYRVTAKAGEITVEVTYLAAGIKAEGQPGLGRFGERVRGRSVTLRLDENRQVSGVRRHAELLKAFADTSDFERAAAETLFGAAGVRELVGRPFDLPPAKALRIGETVARDDQGTVGGLATTGQTMSKLEHVKDGIATVAVRSDMSIKAAEGVGSAPLAGTKVALKTDRAAGSYTFDTRTGRVKEFAHETVIVGSVTVSGAGKDNVIGLTIRQKQSVVVSDKSPVRD